jgi:predicted transposase/invertase (TIGR01784 family)
MSKPGNTNPKRKPRTRAAKQTNITLKGLGLYINLLTDFGFKRVFGIKEVMIHFLNSVLPVEGGITDLYYANTERLGITCGERKAIYDLYCTTKNGEHIIVELQAIYQEYFKDRILFYIARLIQEQARKGPDWDFKLAHIYSINILDFCLDGKPEKEIQDGKYISYVQLIDRDTHKLFYDKLTIVFIELPGFTKELNQLKDFLEQWIYIIRHLHEFDNIPEALRNEIFEIVFQEAEIARMTTQQVTKYFKDLNDMNVVKNEMSRRDRIIAEVRSAYAAEQSAHAAERSAHAAERNAHAATSRTLEAALTELANLKQQFSLN